MKHFFYASLAVLIITIAGGIAYQSQNYTPHYETESLALVRNSLQLYGAIAELPVVPDNTTLLKLRVTLSANEDKLSSLNPPLSKLIWHYRFKRALSQCDEAIHVALNVSTATALRDAASGCVDCIGGFIR